MQSRFTRQSLILLFLLFGSICSQAQNPVNWTEKQLLEPADLATTIAAKKDVPVIISVGPGATIPGSIAIGMVNSPEGLQKLKDQLKIIDKEKKIVIYCGCCPFEHCPNVRPAIDALKEVNFTSYYLLNLPHNIKKDWIDKGYPVTKP
ncbi:MAG: rhodanese-like domain-containing protein [Chitinophagaceae bacterium]|nr:MAG: rhodanese-like domain-containing protein [Chitinophagaceae bacterium]